MSNRVYEQFLKSGLPKRPDGQQYSPTAYNVYRTIAYRFNEKTQTSYPGLNTFYLSTGVGKSAVMRALAELKTGGIISTVLIGRRNQRAEYRPDYHLRILDSVLLDGPINLELGSVPVTDSVPLDEPQGPVRTSNGSGLMDTISTLRIIKTVSNETDRFNLFRSLLPAHLQGLAPGPNVDTCLDRCAVKGIALEVTARHVADHNYDGALNPYAIAITRLERFSQSVSPVQTREQIVQRQADQDASEKKLRAEQNRLMGVPDHENEYLHK